MSYDSDGFISWFLLLMVVLGLFLIYLATSPEVVNTAGQALGSVTGGNVYNYEIKIDADGNEYVFESLDQDTKYTAECYGSIKRNSDGTYFGSCRGDCLNRGSFMLNVYDSDWYCVYCAGVRGSIQCI